jgi:hypothetical protein
MKHCPACNFSFPDFHLVCDFDGTELVPDPDRPELIKTRPRRTFVRRMFTSPKLLTTLAIMAVFLGTAFLAYYQESSRLARTANVQVPPVSLDKTTDRLPRVDTVVSSSNSSVSRAPRPNNSKVAHRLASARPSLAKLSRGRRNEHPSSQIEVAPQLDVPPDKQPKFVAVLKSTWRVLKKPFRF